MDHAALQTLTLNLYDLIAVYFNRCLTENFVVGKVLSLDQDFLYLSLVSKDLGDEGICLCSASYIYRIERESQYLLNLIKKDSSVRQTYCDINSWDSFWKFTESKRFIVQLEGYTGHRIMFGVPLSYTDDRVLLQRVRIDGSLGKTYSINKCKIALAVCNSSAEQNLQKLYLRRNPDA